MTSTADEWRSATIGRIETQATPRRRDLGEQVITVLLAHSDATASYRIGSMVRTDPNLDLVAVADDALTAIRDAIELGPDVALIDWDLAGSGSMAAWEIGERLPYTRVIVLNRWNDIERYYEILEAGAVEVLPANPQVGDLTAAVRRAADW